MAKRSTVKRARVLRKNMTAPEVTLWQWLRTRPDGLKFRRQHPLGPYVLDFYCAAVAVAIEVDGEVHSLGDRPARDAVRYAWLLEQGIRVIRFAATDVQRHLDNVTVAILDACRIPLHHAPHDPPPHPSDGEE